MHTRASAESNTFSVLRFIARFPAGLSRLTTLLLISLSIGVLVPAVGALADWMVEKHDETNRGVRSFLWSDAETVQQVCKGQACRMSAVSMIVKRRPGGEKSTVSSARIHWPAPLIFEASAGAHLEVVGATDALHPVVAQNSSSGESDENESVPFPLSILLANEVRSDGSRRPVTVQAEGFISASALDSDSSSDKHLTPWSPPAEPDRNSGSQEAAIARAKQYLALKFRSIQFQPIPEILEIEVLREAFNNVSPLGHVVMFDWRAEDLHEATHPQIIPSRSMLGNVIQAKEIGQHFRLQVRIPRTHPYGTGHWIWQRLNGMESGKQVLPSVVNSTIFPPRGTLGATPEWSLLEREFHALPIEEVRHAPRSALDSTCAQSDNPTTSCVWVVRYGVATPLQVRVQSLPSGEVSLSERAVFAGKSILAKDWRAMPREFRREFGAPSDVALVVRRPILGGNTDVLIEPKPWLKAGLAVSLRGYSSSSTQ